MDVEAWLIRSLALHGRLFGRDHPFTLAVVADSSRYYHDQGNLEKAKRMCEWARRGFEIAALKEVIKLGSILKDEGSLEAAEGTLQRALEDSKLKLGWNHQLTLITATYLVAAYTDQGKLDDAEELRKRAASENARLYYYGNTPLNLAVRSGNSDLIRLLLDFGVDVNATSADEWGPNYPNGEPMGSTALHTAVFYGRSTIAKELLARGADVDAAGRWDLKTALYIAAEQGHLEVARILLDSGANTNGIYGSGYPPLIAAATKGHEEMVKLLLEKDANIDGLDSDGDPALHSAAYNGHLGIVRLLLGRGSDPKCRGGSQRTASWFAAMGKYPEVASLLKEKGADDQDALDISNDSSTTIQSIGIDRLLADMEKAQAMMFSESVPQQWARKLRFLVQAPRDRSEQYQLELIEEDPFNPEPFVAVSYCWGSASRQESPKLRTTSPTGTRDTRAPRDVILRSFSFAESQGMKRIWIDQECINQDDKAEKQIAIQAMHLVYRRAAATIVLLGRHVWIPSEVSTMHTAMKTNFQSTNTLPDRILGDKWFTRAWCIQEFANSNTTTLWFLVGWKNGIDEDGREWEECVQSCEAGAIQTIPREWIIHFGEIQSMSLSTTIHLHTKYSFASCLEIGAGLDAFTLVDEAVVRKGWHRSTAGPSQRKKDVSEQLISSSGSTERVHHPKELRMHIGMAYATLRGKRNLLVSDRLAILSNLAHYAHRIQTGQLIDEKLSFTACLMALALRNGDLTLCSFAGTEDGDRDTLALSSSWLSPLQFSLENSIPLAFGNFKSKHYDGDPGYVVGNKGLFRGLIWDIHGYDTTGFSELRSVLPELLQLACRTSNSDRSSWIKTLLQVLARQFIKMGYWDLAELLVLSALPRQLENPEEIYMLLSQLESWIHDGGDETWALELHSRHAQRKQLASEHDQVGASLAEGSDSLLPSDRSMLHWICLRIGSMDPLPIGKCVLRSNTGDTRTLIGLFTVDVTKHRKVFTPLSGLEYEFGNNPWAHWEPKRCFGCVDEVQELNPSDADRQKAEGLISGSPDIFLDPKMYRFRGHGEHMALWSHRLSRNGLLEKNEQGGWTTIPFGQAAQYRWIL